MEPEPVINPILHKALIDFYSLYIRTYMRKNHNPTVSEEDRLMSMAQEIFNLMYDKEE